MIDLNKLRKRDLEQLSAYLDGELNENEARQIEARIQTDSQLRLAFQELENTRKLISQLPSVPTPRNFTLTPKMAGIQEGIRLFPIFRFATVIATIAFAVLVGADTFFLRGSGALPLAYAPERMMVEEAPEASIAESEAAEEIQGAPMEDAVIGTEPEGLSVPEEALEQPAELPPTNDEGLTPREPAFQGFGTETGGETFGEESTKVEPAATPISGGTLELEATEQAPMEEPTVIPASEVAPTVVQEIEPTPVPNVPEELRPEVEPLRVVEIGLATLALLSAAITWMLRKAR